MDILQSIECTRFALPINKAILDLAKEPWDTPAICAPTFNRAEERYFLSAMGPEFLLAHPDQNSLVIQADTERSRKPSVPIDQEAKCLDLLGRKAFMSTSLQFYIANYQSAPSVIFSDQSMRRKRAEGWTSEQ